MKTLISENIMKKAITRYLAVACMVAASATYGQDRVQSPEAAGLTPLHGTIYVNDTTDDFNHGGVNNDGIWAVDFTDDHTVLIGFTDANQFGDFNAMGHVWTLYDTNGNRLVPPTEITNATVAPGDTLRTNTWLSFFRTNGTPTPNNTAGLPGPSNRFGQRICGWGAGDRIGLEIPALFDIVGTSLALAVGSTAVASGGTAD
jgi:hypothetical protein